MLNTQRHTHARTSACHTQAAHKLPHDIWFVSHQQPTHGNTHGPLNLNYSPHSTPPSVHLLLLLSLPVSHFFPPPLSYSHNYTHTQSRCRNVYQVWASAGCPLINRSDGEQRSAAIESPWLVRDRPLSSSFLITGTRRGFTLLARPGGTALHA